MVRRGGERRRGIFLGRFRVRSRDPLRLGSSRLLAQGMHTDMRRRVGVRRIYDPSVFFLSLRRPTLSLSLATRDRTMLLISQFGKCRQWAAVTGLKRRAEKAAKKEVSLYLRCTTFLSLPKMFLCLEAEKPRVCKIRKISILLMTYAVALCSLKSQWIL